MALTQLEERTYKAMTLVLFFQGNAFKERLTDREVVFLLHLLRYMDGNWIADVRLEQLRVDMGKKDVSAVESTMRSLHRKWRGSTKALFKREPFSKGNVRRGIFDLRPLQASLREHWREYLQEMKRRTGA